jgi:hypothetical protein
MSCKILTLFSKLFLKEATITIIGGREISGRIFQEDGSIRGIVESIIQMM